MGVFIAPDIIQSSGLSEEDFLLELALSLYEKKILSLGKAAQMASIHRMAFQKELSRREIAIHFSIEDVKKDIKTLDSLGMSIQP